MKTLDVSAGSNSDIETYSLISTNNKSNMNYSYEEFDFKATGSTSTLTFASGDTGSAYGPVIGGVSVLDTSIHSPVPEPSSLLLIGTGLATFAGFLRRKIAA
jgi:hypothetical protein